jgi:flagellar operon protein
METSIQRILGPHVAPGGETGRPDGPSGERPLGPTRAATRVGGVTSPGDSTFAAALAAETRGALQWSAHASRRVEERGIALDPAAIDRLVRAVEAVSGRGARSSVVWLDRVAYVVDIPTATVVTAVAPRSGKEAVFTNIDSVVIA